MRETLYRQMVYCINTYRTWIEVADDNLYKEHIISRTDRTDYLVSRTLVLRAFKTNGIHAEGTKNPITYVTEYPATHFLCDTFRGINIIVQEQQAVHDNLLHGNGTKRQRP